ncbi:MAG TPA: hypothetical protein VGD63_02845 [Steroidobacteraceae bacterium]
MLEPFTHPKLLDHVFRSRGAMLALLSVFRLLPSTLLEHRRGLAVKTSSSRRERSEDEAVINDAYGSMRASNHVRSWKVLVNWIKARGDQPQDYAWLCARIASWPDPSYITRLTEGRVARLVALKRTGEALDVVAQRLTFDPRFRPKSAADTLTLAQLAARGGGVPRVARALLSDFAARFEADPRVAVAGSLARHLRSQALSKTLSAPAGQVAVG